MSIPAAGNTIGDVFRHWAKATPEKIALKTLHGVNQSFAQLNENINRLTNSLLAMGVRKGDRVAILSRNSEHYIETFGLAKAGLVVVPLNWRLQPEELVRLIDHSAAVAVLVEEHFEEAGKFLHSTSPAVNHWIRIGKDKDGWLSYEELLRTGSPEEVDIAVGQKDPLCIIYTSGTTGLPKGVSISHAGALCNARVAADEMLQMVHEDITLAVMPMFHVGGMWYHCFPSIASGCTTLILNEFNPAVVLKALVDYRISNVHLVPTMIAALINQPEAKSIDLSHVRLIFYAASSMPPTLLKEAMQVFSGCGFAQAYGSTEGGVVTVLDPEAHLRAKTALGEHLLGSCGRPMRDRDVRIVDDDERSVSFGSVGEIEVKSPGLMSGYWNDEVKTRQAVHGGWLKTGDMGYFDGEGFLYIVDRRNDMIVTGGENVFPTEVEAVLYEDADIQEVAVFGIPDPKWVETVVAAVVLKAGSRVSGEEIQKRLKAKIASYKCPKDIYIVEQLPKSAVGKVLRKDLKSKFASSGVTAK
jgi:acyl-CoA synthetase (AMP-forming)/AMP-acid ligase II